MESSVINKYSAQIAKANECFTFGRDLFFFLGYHPYYFFVYNYAKKIFIFI